MDTKKKIHILAAIANITCLLCLLSFIAAALVVISYTRPLYAYILLGISVLSAVVSAVSRVRSSYIQYIQTKNSWKDEDALPATKTDH